jgi:hypothetical protein
MKAIIHVNQHIVKDNSKFGETNPVITLKTYNSNTYTNKVEVKGDCIVVYSPDKPLSCDAWVWNADKLPELEKLTLLKAEKADISVVEEHEEFFEFNLIEYN